MICDMIVFHKIMTIHRRIFVVECQCLHFTNGDRVIPLIWPISCQKSAKETDIINLADVECRSTGWSNSILVGRESRGSRSHRGCRAAPRRWWRRRRVRRRKGINRKRLVSSYTYLLIFISRLSTAVRYRVTRTVAKKCLLTALVDSNFEVAFWY